MANFGSTIIINQATAASGPIVLYPNVHLIGAGDTENPATGTVMEAAPGADIEGVVEVNCISAPWCTELASMSLVANGGVAMTPHYDSNGNLYYSGGVIFDENPVVGVAIDDVTVDATTDNPANPAVFAALAPYTVLPDVYFSQSAQGVQINNSTFIGPGVTITNAANCSLDNDQFFGCGAQESAQISYSGLEISVTRCTVQSLVNNIANPGGNVEYDGADNLLAVGPAGNGVYAGNNTATDLYDSPENSSYSNVGEQILVDGNANDLVAYQNTLSGDGAESYLSNTCGVEFEGGSNHVIADNDLSNAVDGIAVWINNGLTTGSFNMYTGNSIHNVYDGIDLILGLSTASQNQPWFDCNSFSHNSINGIRVGSVYYAPQPAGIYIATYAAETNNPPQVLMNVFNGNTVTGAAVGLELVNKEPSLGSQIGEMVLSNSLFDSDGSEGSYEIQLLGISENPVASPGDVFEGYWIN
jgi:hypothetical protein